MYYYFEPVEQSIIFGVLAHKITLVLILILFLIHTDLKLWTSMNK